MGLIITVVFMAHVFTAHSRPLAIPHSSPSGQYPMLQDSGLEDLKRMLKVYGKLEAENSI